MIHDENSFQVKRTNNSIGCTETISPLTLCKEENEFLKSMLKSQQVGYDIATSAKDHVINQLRWKQSKLDAHLHNSQKQKEEIAMLRSSLRFSCRKRYEDRKQINSTLKEAADTIQQLIEENKNLTERLKQCEFRNRTNVRDDVF